MPDPQTNEPTLSTVEPGSVNHGALSRFPQASPHHCPTYLYRYFDQADRLLYVGITYCFHTRADQHSATALWWRHARRATCELFPSRGMASCAELNIIHDEDPIHNGHRKRPAPPRPYDPDLWFFKQQGKKWVGVDKEEWAVTPSGLEPARPTPDRSLT